MYSSFDSQCWSFCNCMIDMWELKDVRNQQKYYHQSKLTGYAPFRPFHFPIFLSIDQKSHAIVNRNYAKSRTFYREFTIFVLLNGKSSGNFVISSDFRELYLTKTKISATVRFWTKNRVSYLPESLEVLTQNELI